MRRISTLPRLAEYSSTTKPSWPNTICLFCQHQSTSSSRRSFTTTTLRLARPRPAEPTSNPDFLERTRRRIWGTDTPPGAADPYARPAPVTEESAVSPLEEGELEDVDIARRMAEDQYRQDKAELQSQVEQAPTHEDYVPATTWEGLEMVGGEKEWDEGRKVFSG